MREALAGQVPSAGVGTCFSRRAVTALLADGAMVRDVAEYMAVLKGVAVEELAQVTTDNFNEVLSIRAQELHQLVHEGTALARTSMKS